MIAIFMKASASRTAYRTNWRYFKPKTIFRQGPSAALSVPFLIPLEYRLDLAGKSLEGAAEISRGHAQRLRHRFGLDRLLHRHRPFHGQHPLGHGVGEGRPFRDLAGELLRLRQDVLGGDDAAEEAPALALLRGHEAAGIEQLGGARLADDARQDRAGAHVAAGQSHLVEEE